jgi:hypothetical protein
MKNSLIKLGNLLDQLGQTRSANKITLLLKKIALTPRLENLKVELRSQDQPLAKLMEVYREAESRGRNDLIALFDGDSDRAEDFDSQYPGGYIPNDVEEDLIREFGQDKVDYHLYGIGTDENLLTVDDVQELLLHLLDTHPRLRRRRDKTQIKERFGISTWF